MRTVIQLLPARDAAAYQAAASDALTAAIVRYETAARSVPPVDLAALEQGRATAVGVGTLRDIEPIHREVKRAQTRLLSAKETKSAPAQLKLIAIDSYDHRGALKSEGYRFAPQGYWIDFVGAQTCAAWVRTINLIDAESVAAALKAIEAARQRGTVEGDSVVNQLSAEVRR